MGLFDWLFGETNEGATSFEASEPIHMVNPANGLPMQNDAIDIAGNLFGTDAYDHSHQDMQYDGSSDWMTTHSSCFDDGGGSTSFGWSSDSPFD